MNDQSSTPNVVLLFGFILHVTLMTAISWYCAATYLEWSEASSWAETQGVIERFESADYTTAHSVEVDYARIRYRYRVGSKQFVGSRISISEAPKDVKRLGEQFPVGAQVPVFYEPSRPDNAVLRRGSPNNFYWGIGLATYALMMTAWFGNALRKGKDAY